MTRPRHCSPRRGSGRSSMRVSYSARSVPRHRSTRTILTGRRPSCSASVWGRVQRAADRVLPADFGYELTGITYQQLKAGAVAGIVFVLAMVFAFLFLAAQYESWSMPFMDM